jgi:MFS transporter, MCT family, solute carrier family 16 (monocarboxylic acid transporters), member 10
MTYGTVLSYYISHLLPNTSKLLICLIGAVPGFFVLAMSLLWGRLLDAGHHKKINIFGGVCLTAGMIGLAFSGGNGTYGAGKVWAILLAAIPVGIGQSCYFVAAPHTAATWFPKCKGRAIGFTNSGAALGELCLTYMCSIGADIH